MNIVVIDLEFNQATEKLKSNPKCPFEIIQIGAVTLDVNFDCVKSFDRFVKPQIYEKMNPYVSSLTGINIKDLLFEETYEKVFYDFIEYLNHEDTVFCTWGNSDMKELFRNSKFYGLPISKLPHKYIDLQPYVSKYLRFPSHFSVRLQDALKFLGIESEDNFHNAYYDAYYTSKILKKIHHLEMIPVEYDPNPAPRAVPIKKLTLNTYKLLNQFEKMYERQLTIDEQSMIKLAYLMGKTRQFLE